MVVVRAWMVVAVVCALTGCPDDTEGTSDTSADVVADMDAQADAVPDVEPETVADTDADAVPETVADADADAAPETVADADADAEPETVADADVDAEPETVADADADAAPEVTDAGPDGEVTTPGDFVYNTTCSIPADPSSSSTISYEEVFENAGFDTPMDLTFAPDGTDRIFVAEREGIIKVMPNDPDGGPATVFLAMSSSVDANGEGGLLAIAFHPDYAANGTFFTSHTEYLTGGFHNVITRWQVSAGDPDVADPTSAEVLLTVLQQATNHNGGDLAFGQDGYLYISIGDGGPQGDPEDDAIDTLSWLGKILRIDIDDPGDGVKPYGIPADNPFVGDDGGLDEIFAYGFRNPWRMSFDSLTGDLWVGDVGQNTIEEIDIVTLGGHYGWAIFEGSNCYKPALGCDPAGKTFPVVEYDHSVGNSITGGFVYRGTAVPSLYGAYVFGDYGSSVIFAFKYGEEAPPVDEGDALFPNGPGGLGSFGEDADGEVYMLSLWSGIYRFVETPDAPPPVDFPQTLTETGCFSDVENLVPAEGLLSYDVNTPLWSDSALKKRWVVLPDGGQIGYDATGKWSFPDGTIFIKHFGIETEQGNPSTLTRLETRFIVLDGPGQVRGYTYRWNGAGTEATLLPGADTRDLTLQLSSWPSPQPYTWQFPSRSQCNSCHTDASGGVLGLETGQLNGPHTYPELGGATMNQLDAIAAWGLFEGGQAPDPGAAVSYPPPGDTGADVTERARAYLQANCANCHLQGGPSGLEMDLQYTTPLDGMQACGVDPVRGDLGITGAKILAPGDASTSVLWQRMVQGKPHRMPPIATSIVDEAGSAVVEQWIDGLSGCTP